MVSPPALRQQRCPVFCCAYLYQAVLCVYQSTDPVPEAAEPQSGFEQYFAMAKASPYTFSTWEYVLSIVDKEVRAGEAAFRLQ